MLDKYLAMKRFYRCSALFLCWMAKRISGWGICVSPFVVFCLFVVVCAVDLPFYMTTGVNVDVILNRFFTCKDRASERDRPYQRKKKEAFLPYSKSDHVSHLFVLGYDLHCAL